MYESKYKHKHAARRAQNKLIVAELADDAVEFSTLVSFPIEEADHQNRLGLAAQRFSEFNQFSGNPYLNGQAAQQMPNQYRGMLGLGPFG